MIKELNIVEGDFLTIGFLEDLEVLEVSFLISNGLVENCLVEFLLLQLLILIPLFILLTLLTSTFISTCKQVIIHT